MVQDAHARSQEWRRRLNTIIEDELRLDSKMLSTWGIIKRIYDGQILYEEGKTHPKLMNVAMHPYLAGRPHRTKALETIIKYAKSFPNVWFAKREEIARWWLEHYAD